MVEFELIHSNKTIKVYGKYSNKAFMTLLITSIYVLCVCLPEVDLGWVKVVPNPALENLGIFLTYALFHYYVEFMHYHIRHSVCCILW